MAHPIPIVLASFLDQISLTGLVTLSLLVMSTAVAPVAHGDDPLDCFDLLRAAQHNDTTVLRRALQASVPVDCRNDRQQTPLLVATMYDAIDTARLLIGAGADVNAQDDRHDSPLLYAGAEGPTEILTLILKARPNFKVYNRFGGTALIPDCERGHVEAVHLLVKTPVDLNHLNRLGSTTRVETVILGQGGPRHQDIVRLLIEAGADPDLADNEGVTALQHAQQRGHREIEALLREAGAR